MIRRQSDSEHVGGCYAWGDVRIIEVRNPGMPLAARTADVEQVPTNSSAVHRHIKDVLGNAHRLDARIVCNSATGRPEVVHCA